MTNKHFIKLKKRLKLSEFMYFETAKYLFLRLSLKCGLVTQDGTSVLLTPRHHHHPTPRHHHHPTTPLTTHMPHHSPPFHNTRHLTTHTVNRLVHLIGFRWVLGENRLHIGLDTDLTVVPTSSSKQLTPLGLRSKSRITYVH